MIENLKKLKERLYSDSILKYAIGRGMDIITTSIGVNTWGAEIETNPMLKDAMLSYGIVGGLCVHELKFSLPILLSYYGWKTLGPHVKKLRKGLDLLDSGFDSFIEGVGVVSMSVGILNTLGIIHRGYDIPSDPLIASFLGISLPLWVRYVRKTYKKFYESLKEEKYLSQRKENEPKTKYQ